jgi:hypothetical protein
MCICVGRNEDEQTYLNLIDTFVDFFLKILHEGMVPLKSMYRTRNIAYKVHGVLEQLAMGHGWTVDAVH